MDEEMYLAAADVGGTTIKFGFFTLDGQLVRKWEIPTDTSNKGRNILKNLCGSVTAEAGDHPVQGLGIGLPGPVDRNHVVHKCVNLGWGDVELMTAVREYLPEVPVLKFGNDASMAALGELWKGAGSNYGSAYLLTLGTGIGGGYAHDGEVEFGANGAAGEAGHITINPRESVKCNCGRKGCLEQYASASGVVRLAKNLLRVKNGTDDKDTVHIERLFDLDVPGDPTMLERLDKFTSKDIFDLAKMGDPFCGYTVRVLSDCLGLAMSCLSCAVDPEVFILGGGMSNAGKILSDSIKKSFLKFCYPAAVNTDVTIAELGNDAGIYGCARMLMG